MAKLAWGGSVTLSNREARAQDTPFRVMARKRPLLSVEGQASAYDCVSIEGKNNAAVVHDGRVHRDGRTLYMTHSRFCLDRIFSEADDNTCIYTEALQPLVQRVARGARATLLLFGQTGTGKTYTARGVLAHLEAELFRDEHNRVSVRCYEIAGTRGGREAVFDLLAERKPIKCLTGEDGHVHVRGACVVECTTVDQLRAALETSFAWRSSEATERNEASSRSHAVIELHLAVDDAVRPGDAVSSDDPGMEPGVLRIVDLAGSERNFETQLHTRKMAERGGHINYSLLMLKECARVMHRNRQRLESNPGTALQHIPFRSSRLTHLLQKCFTDADHRTVVVTTLSPSPVDVEHTLNSLQHVGMMRTSRPWDFEARRAARAWGEAAAEPAGGREEAFSKVEGRGHALHSKLQDARAGQLKLHAFGMVTGTGGSVMKKYEPENVKNEAFIDPRWHREMNVAVEDDLWVLREADAEALQLLTSWQEEQWEARRAHDVGRWAAAGVQAFVRGLGLAGEVRLPSTMTGAQLCRLGPRGLAALCSDLATAEALHQALQGERAAARQAELSQAGRNAKMAALGVHRLHAALEGD